MNPRALLDADMATVWGWVRNGFEWWTAELAAMVPSRWRLGSGSGRYLAWSSDGGLTFCVKGRHLPATEAASARLPLLVAPDDCFIRTIDLPRMSRADRERLIALDAERLLPMPPVSLLVGYSVDSRSAGTGDPQPVSIAALPRGTAERIIAQVRAAGASVERFAVASPDDPARWSQDLTPAARTIGLLAAPSSLYAACWSVFACLFLANGALLIWRDSQKVAQLQELVDAQAPSLTAVHAMRNRIETMENDVSALAGRRHVQDAPRILGDVTRAMPARAWIQRFTWDGRRVRISGYRQVDADVLGAMRKTAAFADVRVATAEVGTETPSGQPFDITMLVRRPVP